MRAAQALDVRWEPGAAATASSADVLASLRQAVRGKEFSVLYERGDVDAAKQASGRTVIGADYEVPFLAHAAMGR
jgi:isoquinoline 1-oxidoreductase beta subunit